MRNTAQSRVAINKKKRLQEIRKRKMIKRIIKEEMLIVSKFGQIHNMVVEQEKRMLREGIHPKRIRLE